MIDELNISDTTKFIDANSDCYQEIVFRNWSKNSFDFFVYHEVFLGPDFTLAIYESLSDVADFLTILREKSEAFVKWEVFFSLIAYLSQSFFSFVLVDRHLDFESLVIWIHSATKLGQVSKLSQK